jgi:lipopolysaccharide export system protein LptC
MVLIYNMFSQRWLLIWGLPLLGIALLTTWLVWDIAGKSDRRKKSDVAFPDYTLKDFVSVRMNEQGQLVALLHASTMQHYPEINTKLTRPYLVFYQNAQPLWYVLAESGQISPDQSQIWLNGKTYLWRSALSPEQLPIEIHTTEVHILVPEQIAETAAPTQIFNGKNNTSGVGMKVWLQTHLVELRSNVRGHYAPQP